MAEAAVLHEALVILLERFHHAGKYSDAALQVRAAEAELVSRARHPSRQAPSQPFGGALIRFPAGELRALFAGDDGVPGLQSCVLGYLAG